MLYNPNPFTYQEALNLWSWLVSGWAHSLDNEGARTLIDGVPNRADVGGSYEGVTRMLWGIGGWFSQPGRSRQVTWRDETFDLEALTRRALVNGCDPLSPSYWGVEYVPGRFHDQRTVETGQVAFALWQTRALIWDTLKRSEQENIFNFLERFAQRPDSWYSNWALFWVLNHACRKALNLPHDQSIIDEVLGQYMDGVYCGDGWYDDAAQRGAGYFDDYNTWVFASHVLAWAQVDGHNWPERRDELLDRIRAWMQHYPSFFAANGAYSEFGRSLAYKFARLGAPLWAYKMGVWPHSTGMLKRLVGRHLRWYADRGAIRRDGTLSQPLAAGGSSEICEPYISTGATYWAMQAFGGLWSLPDDDPFWSVEEEPLPAEAGDYIKVFHQPGWVVAATNGEIERFNGGSVKPIGAKYAKFAYGTRHPFNVGVSDGFSAPDNMLSLTDGVARGQRTKNLAYAVGEPGWLRFRWQQDLNSFTHTIETVIVVHGEQHIRAHRITLDPRLDTPLSAIEGSAPLGFGLGDMPQVFGGHIWRATSVADRMAAIFNIRGFEKSKIWQEAGGINCVYPFYVLPVLTADRIESSHDLMCLVHNGGLLADTSLLLDEINGTWQHDGAFRLVWGSEETLIPPLETA